MACICALGGVAALVVSFVTTDPSKDPLAASITAPSGGWLSRQVTGYLGRLQDEHKKWETSCGAAMSQHGLCKVCVTKPRWIDLVALSMAVYQVGPRCSIWTHSPISPLLLPLTAHVADTGLLTKCYPFCAIALCLFRNVECHRSPS